MSILAFMAMGIVVMVSYIACLVSVMPSCIYEEINTGVKSCVKYVQADLKDRANDGLCFKNTVHVEIWRGKWDTSIMVED